MTGIYNNSKSIVAIATILFTTVVGFLLLSCDSHSLDTNDTMFTLTCIIIVLQVYIIMLFFIYRDYTFKHQLQAEDRQKINEIHDLLHNMEASFIHKVENSNKDNDVDNVDDVEGIHQIKSINSSDIPVLSGINNAALIYDMTDKDIMVEFEEYLKRRKWYDYIFKESQKKLEKEKELKMINTMDYVSIVFTKAGYDVTEVEKVCDQIRSFVESGNIIPYMDRILPNNNNLRNTEIKVLLVNIINYNDIQNVSYEDLLLSYFAMWFKGKRLNLSKNYNKLPADSIVTKNGLLEDVTRLRSEYPDLTYQKLLGL